MTFQTLPMEETEMNEDVKECVVCLGSEEEGEKDSQVLKSVTLIKSLEKECNCDYLVHEACLEEWLSTNPVCPICKTCTYYTTPPQRNEKKVASSGEATSVARCLYKYLCCVTSPGSIRNSPTS